MSKVCADCVFYAPKKDGASCGTCDYPVPGWLKICVSSGGFVNGYEAENCPTFKSRADVVEGEIKAAAPAMR